MLPTLSHLSVNLCPESCLRHWCSSRYLRIPPLHREFRFPLRDSRKAVLDAVIRLSLTLKHPTYQSACVPFTPNKSEQRSPHTYYRGCWHVISRGFRIVPSSPSLFDLTYSSHSTELYNPKAFIVHAAWLRQGFPHCARFLTAASRRSLDRVSVPVWPIILSDRLSVVALVGHYPTNKLIDRRLISKRMVTHPLPFQDYGVLASVSRSCPPLRGRFLRVTHPSATRQQCIATPCYRSTCMFKTRRQRSF